MSESEQHMAFMREAIALAEASAHIGCGPFGAVVVRAGRIIGRGSNRVTRNSDPTAHAEMVAIRDACANQGDFSLAGCVLYTSCEPCPMCLAAAYWARLDRVYYAATREEAAAIGFDDARIYREVCLPLAQRELLMRPLLHDEAQAAFATWLANPDRIDY